MVVWTTTVVVVVAQWTGRLRVATTQDLPVPSAEISWNEAVVVVVVAAVPLRVS